MDHERSCSHLDEAVGRALPNQDATATHTHKNSASPFQSLKLIRPCTELTSRGKDRIQLCMKLIKINVP